MSYRKNKGARGTPPSISPDFISALEGRSSRQTQVQKPEYHTLALCRQVQRILILDWSGGDDLLCDTHVQEVIPAPNASRLVVKVVIKKNVSVVQFLECIANHSARLRKAVANGITRKRVPELTFIPVSESGGES